MMGNASVNDLLARLEELESEVARLKREPRSNPTTAAAADSVPGIHGDETSRPARRDLLRFGTLALGAAAVGLAPKTAEAADGGPILIGTANTGTVKTQLSAAGINDAVFLARANTGLVSAGLWGETNSIANDSVGVGGAATATSGMVAGVFGQSQSSDGAGVFGEATAAAGANFGVWGETQSPGGFAVFGRNLVGHGILGVTASAANGAAVIGSNSGVAGAWAGVFVGPVLVTGAHTVLGTKSAAVPHPDGSHRLLYCVESPESWFEDFGNAQLQRGSTTVAFDPDFAAVADMENYHVFVTPYNEHAELMVSERTACGFRVTAKDPSSVEFSWRVVAKRKDVVAERLAKVSVPELDLKTPPVGSWKRRG